MGFVTFEIKAHARNVEDACEEKVEKKLCAWQSAVSCDGSGMKRNAFFCNCMDIVWVGCNYGFCRNG